MSAVDAYKTLGLRIGANLNQIKTAYRDLTLKYHPDRNKSLEAVQIYADIREAYDTIILLQNGQMSNKCSRGFQREANFTMSSSDSLGSPISIHDSSTSVPQKYDSQWFDQGFVQNENIGSAKAGGSLLTSLNHFMNRRRIVERLATHLDSQLIAYTATSQKGAAVFQALDLDGQVIASSDISLGTGHHISVEFLLEDLLQKIEFLNSKPNAKKVEVITLTHTHPRNLLATNTSQFTEGDRRNALDLLPIILSQHPEVRFEMFLLYQRTYFRLSPQKSFYKIGYRVN